MTLDFSVFRDFGIALFIGALVGVDRERKNAAQERRGIGGLRTFILIAEAGAISAWLSLKLASPWIFALSGVGLAALVFAGYFAQAREQRDDYGLTTEIAALVVFLLGGTALFGHPEVAVALAIATSAVLAFKEPLHGFVGRLSKDDLHAVLKLLIASFIVLPILPRKPVDPLGALNPYKMWLLVILIAGLSFVGYVASRWLGTRRGTALAGFFGGLVSSTATTLGLARRSRQEGKGAGLEDAIVCAILLSWSVMFVRVIVEVAVVNAALLARTLIPMAAMGTAAVASSAVFYFRSSKAASAPEEEPLLLKNPFSLTSAIKFALLFAGVLLLVKLVEQHVPGRGLYALAAVAGTTDVDAITLSMADYARTGDPRVAVISIVIAIVANTLVKAGFVLVLGAKALRGRVAVATLIILAASATAFLVP